MIGPITVALIGSLIVAEAWTAAQERATEHEPMNRPDAMAKHSEPEPIPLPGILIDPQPQHKIKTRINTIRGQRADLTGRLDTLTKDLTVEAAFVDTCLQLMTNPHELYAQADDDTRRKLNQVIFHRLYIYQDDVTGHQHNPALEHLAAPLDHFSGNHSPETTAKSSGSRSSSRQGRSSHAVGSGEGAVLSNTPMVEAIRRNSNFSHLSNRWPDLRKRIRKSSPRLYPLYQDNEFLQRKRFLTFSDNADIALRYEAGETTQQIGTHYGISKTRVADVLRGQGITVRRQGLTDQQVREAASLYTAGRSLEWIGGRYGVAHTTVATALRRHGTPLRPRPGWSHDR